MRREADDDAMQHREPGTRRAVLSSCPQGDVLRLQRDTFTDWSARDAVRRYGAYAYFRIPYPYPCGLAGAHPPWTALSTTFSLRESRPSRDAASSLYATLATCSTTTQTTRVPVGAPRAGIHALAEDVIAYMCLYISSLCIQAPPAPTVDNPFRVASATSRDVVS